MTVIPQPDVVPVSAKPSKPAGASMPISPGAPSKIGRAFRAAGRFIKRHPGSSFVAGLAVLAASDTTIRATTPDYSVPGSYAEPVCTNPKASPDRKAAELAQCIKTAGAIADAVPLWRKSFAARTGRVAPVALNIEYALRAATIESDMGRLRQAPGSTFEGLFQFNRKQKRYLLNDNMARILAALRFAKDDIPVLRKYPAEKITRELVISDAVYFDPIVQVFMKMETAEMSYQSLRRYEGFEKLYEWQQHALLYFRHNLPGMANLMAAAPGCEKSVVAIAPQWADLFKANSGLYKSGHAIPPEVLTRFYNLTEKGLALGPDAAKHKTKEPKRHTRWGQWGWPGVAMSLYNRATACSVGSPGPSS